MIRIVDVNGQLKVTTNQQFRDNTFAILGSADQTKRVRIEVDGLTTATTRTLTAPDADIEIQGTHDVISANWNARNHGAYTVVASGTATDPGTPAVGHEFTTLVRNGTVTTSRGSYAVSGTLVRSVWHSGSWTDYPYGPLNAANTWTAAQTFSASARFNAAEAISCGMAATAGNGLLQLASGTTKANGVAFGTDTWLFRKAGGQVQLESGNSNRLTLHTINNDYSVLEFLTNDSSAHTVHLQGSSYGLEVISTAGNNGLRVGFTAGANNPYKLWVNGASRFDGNVGFNSTAPIAKPTAAAVATDAATTQTLANSLRTILIDYGLAS